MPPVAGALPRTPLEEMISTLITDEIILPTVMR